jgi:ADP-heptose:LPS heptosyltransferase
VRARSIERVVIVFPGALGDFLLALPALRGLRERHPDARMSLVVSEPLRSLARLTGAADAVVSLDGADAARLFGGDALPGWLAGRPIVYSWLGAVDDEVRARVSAAAAHARFFRVERGPSEMHAAAAYVRAIGGTASVSALAAAARIVLPAPSAPATPGAELVVHPGAGAPAKRWDPAGFVQVAHWWRQMGGTVVEIAGPAEAGEVPLLGGTMVRDLDLGELAGLLARGGLYLGNDSGVSHLAGAVGAAGVVVFGPTEARRWRPIAGNLVALQARGTEPRGLGLTTLPAARVIAALRRRLTLTRGGPEISVRA